VSKEGSPLDVRPQSRPQPDIVTIGDVSAYDYLSNRQQSQVNSNQPQQVSFQQLGQQQVGQQGSSSSSTSHSPSGFSSSAAAAAGAGATTSTSTRSGIDKVEETPMDNEYYPCIDGNCQPELEFDEFAQDYKNEDEELLDDLFGPQPDNAEPGDAVVLASPTRTRTPPPVFKECTTLEECLGTGSASQDDDHAYLSNLTPLDYEYYDLTSEDRVDPIRPPQEASLGVFDQPGFANSEIQKPQDSIVTRPVFSPDGTLLFEAEKSRTEEKLDKLIDSLGSFIHLLNATKDQGNSLSSVSIDQSSLANVPPGFGAGQMGTLALPTNNKTEELIQQQSLFDNSIAHHLGDHPLQGSAFFNIKTPLEPVAQQNNAARTTIPPHLIPLGADGTPLLNPDGTPVLKTGNPLLALGDNRQKLTDIFPFLDPQQQYLHQIASLKQSINESRVDNRDLLTRVLNYAREMPMDTRRRMFAGLTMGVPMAALTMASMGLPTLAIAPMALAIPGFLFAAFTETMPTNTRSREGQVPLDHGHDAHGHHGAGGHGHQGAGGHGHHGGRRRGIAGLIDAVRRFRVSQNLPQNATNEDALASSRQDPDAHAHDHGPTHHHFSFG
jgi:hypothetical protein